MIWSEGRNFCFIHIPKTGGSAISKGYARVMNFGDVLLGGPRFAEELSRKYRSHWGIHKHSFASRVVEVIGTERFCQSFSFAVIRDPLARMVSYYRWLHRKVELPCLSEAQKRLKQCGTFKQFVEQASKEFAPQVDYVQDPAGALLVSELFLYERLTQDWPRILKHMGISFQLPIANRSPNIEVQIDEEVEDIMRERYPADYTLVEQIKRAD